MLRLFRFESERGIYKADEMAHEGFADSHNAVYEEPHRGSRV